MRGTNGEKTKRAQPARGAKGEGRAAAKGGEDFEVTEMYPAYKAAAEAQDEKQALRSMNWALEAEKVHSALYGAAKAKVDAKEDCEGKDIWVCTACGFTVEGEAPEICPVCGAKHAKFRKF